MGFFYSRVGPKVLEVESGLIRLVPVLPGQKGALIREYGKSLQIQNLTLGDRLWVLDEDWKCRVRTDEGTLTFAAKRGWLSDLLSIPEMAEGIEKRDGRKALEAGLCHDIVFGTHDLSFELGNDLFYQIQRLRGESKWRSLRKWQAVSSPFGREAYERIRPDYEREWARITWDA